MRRVYILFVLVIFSQSLLAFDKDRTYSFTVLHTNDHHGAFWKSSQSEYGMAARATLIKKIRKEVAASGGRVLLLSGGDINTGTPESELADAIPDFKGMNYMGYDAMAVGNHEFDKNLSVLLRQQRLAEFDFLSANIYKKGSHERLFPASKTIDFEGLKIVLLGLTTDQTPQQSIRFPKDQYELRSPIEESKKIVPQLKSQSNVLIALTHMGHYPEGKHGSRSPGDVTLARSVSGIDLIIGGHSQKPLFEPDYQNGTHIFQAGEWGKHVGRVDLEFKNGKLKVLDSRLIPVNLKDERGGLVEAEIEEDPRLLEILSPFKKEAEKITETVEGHLAGKFVGHRSVIRKQETNLGNFVCFLMARNTDSDIAVIDSGVIRSGLSEGMVTYGDILKVHPIAFGLEIVSVEFSGQELWGYLKEVAIKTSGAFPQYHNIRVTLRGETLVKVETKNESDWREIDPTETYKMASTDFLARGGDGYPRIDNHPSYKKSGITDSLAMKRYFLSQDLVIADDFAPVGNLIRLED